MTEEKWLQDNLFDFENEGEKKNTPPEETKDSGEEKKGKNTDDFRVPPEGENPYFDKYFAEHHLRVNPIRARLLREAVETLSRNRDTPAIKRRDYKLGS
ncbi:MAG: hypothetical protein KatS3mg101_0194 [Patescibacteria group bacterium]|nr:MAG: hypothetical protein KatS3mg101_0194 [Patescibacteria group bacterium]